MSSITKFDVKKFNGSNDFGLWRVKMRCLLIQHGWEAALDPFPRTMTDADKTVALKTDVYKKAHSALLLCLDNKVLREVNKEASAARLFTFYMHSDKKLSEHIDEFNKLIGDLANIDVDIDDEDQALMLLTSLPSSYDNFVETLLYERESLELGEDKDCPKRNKKKSTGFVKKNVGQGFSMHSEGYDNGDLLMAVSEERFLEWIMDSGSSYHMTPRRDFLLDFKEFNCGTVLLGDNRACAIKGTGKVRVQMKDGSSFVLENAPGVVKLEIGGNVNFEIKSQFMHELRKDTFSGNKVEDAHNHIDRVLSILGLFNILGVSKDAVMLQIFPFTLIGSAKRWVDRLAPGTINTWDLLKRPLSKGPIPRMRSAQALIAIQTMDDHSQKWHDGTTSRNIGSSSSKDGLAALVNKLDNLGRDMKKLKESVHAIQVGCQICKGPHLDKDCPLNEEVKQVEEVRYGEFGRTTPFNGNNGGKFRVGPPGYYTKTDNRPPYGERRQSLEELLAKHQEESARRSTEMEVWIKKLQENAEINTRNQNASLKNLETQIEQLTEELRSRKEKSEQAKVVIVEHEGPSSPKKIKNLHGISFLSDSQEENTNDQLPTKESNPGHFTLPCTIGNFNFYAMADLGASVNVLPRNIFEYLELTNLSETEMLVEMADMRKKAPLGIVRDILVKIDKFLFPSDFVILDQTPNSTVILGRPFLATVHAHISVFEKEISVGIGDERVEDSVWSKRYSKWCDENSHDKKPRPRDYTFKEWVKLKKGHLEISKSVRKDLFRSWVIDQLDPDKKTL
ncbi:retrovirus-related pol polyprotein from transposon TNT 1-94 [Tanacetum coccineum]